MKTIINIDNQQVIFQRNWFTGSFIYSVKGITGKMESALNFETHFSARLSKYYDVKIGEKTINIVKTRPLLFAGFRPHNYKFYIENKLIKEVESL